MNIIDETDASEASEGLSGLQDLTLAELAGNNEAAHIVARLTRKEGDESEPVLVAAFNSYI
jgi:hypothetical protein